MYKWEDRSTCLVSRISTQKEPFPRSEFTPGSIWTYWMLIDHQMQSDFHVGTTQVDFEVDRPPPANSPTGDLLITMVKEMVILFKKRVRKWKKSCIYHSSESDENAKWQRDCLWQCQACKRGFTCRPVQKNFLQEAHSYPQADICSAPHSDHNDTHTYTH